MKKLRILTSIVLILGSLSGLSQTQVDPPIIQGFSIYIGYAPYTSFSWAAKEPGPGIDIFFPNSYGIGFEYQFKTKLAISSGISYKSREIFRSTVINDPLFTLSEETTNNYKYINIPIVLRYNLMPSSSVINIIGIFGFTNSFYNYKCVGTNSLTGDISIDESNYMLFYNVGIGFELKSFKRISVIAEPSFGYAFVSNYSSHCMAEVLVGIKYSVNKPVPIR